MRKRTKIYQNCQHFKTFSHPLHIFQIHTRYCQFQSDSIAIPFFIFFKETKTIYMISHYKGFRRNTASCFSACPTGSGGYFNRFPDPQFCPTGYKEIRMNQTCAECSDEIGSNFKCKCTNWMTCAQRGFGKVYGCRKSTPFMLFKVRECKQSEFILYSCFFLFYKCLTVKKRQMSNQ